MYQNTGAIIDTKIGTGEAIVQDKLNLDLSETGAAAARNSDAYKKGEQKIERNKAVGEIPFEFGDVVKPQRQRLEFKAQKLKDYLYNPDTYNEPDWQDKAELMSQDIEKTHAIFKNDATAAKEKLKAIRKEGKESVTGAEDLRMIMNPNFDIGPFQEDLSDADISAMFYDAVSKVQPLKNFDYKDLIKTYPLDSYSDITVSGGVESKYQNKTLSLTNLADAKVNGNVFYGSGEATENETASVPNYEARQLYRDSRAFVLDKYKNEINNIPDPEDKEKFIRDKAVNDWYVNEVKNESEANISNANTPEKDKNKGDKDKLDPSQYGVTTETIPTDVEGTNVGTITRGVSKVPEIDVPVEYQEDKTSGKMTSTSGTTNKIYFDGDKKMVSVTVLIKPGKNSILKNRTSKQEEPYEELRGSMKAKEIEIFDKLYRKIEDEGVDNVDGLTKNEVNVIKKSLSKNLGRGFNHDASAKKVANDAFGDLATNVSDPGSTNDIKFTFKGYTYKLNIDGNDEDKATFWRLAAQAKRGRYKNTINAADIKSKADSYGYSEEEYRLLLEKNGVEIIE